MKNKYFSLLLILVITVSLIGCSKQNNSVIEISKDDKNLEYLKKSNEYLNNALMKFYEVSINDEIDYNYVLNWDAYNKEYDDNYKISYEEYGQEYPYYTAYELLFPENIKLRQIISQKIRKDYSKYIDEDSILRTVQSLVDNNVKPTEKDKNSSNFNEEDWYAEQAIQRILYEDSEMRISNTINIIKPYAELKAYLDLNPDILDSKKMLEFKQSGKYNGTKQLLKESEDYLNGKLPEEETIYFGYKHGNN